MKLTAMDVFAAQVPPWPPCSAPSALGHAAPTGKLGGVFTLAELEDDGPLAGADARLRAAALEALEAADRCAVFTGATSAEAGVKFFREE